jgi:hypothetical protein
VDTLVVKPRKLAAIRLLRLVLDLRTAAFEQDHPLAESDKLYRQRDAGRTCSNDAHIRTAISAGVVSQ